MKCPLCNNDLMIASSFLEPRQGADGSTEIYSVVDLMCTDSQCPNGKRKMPVTREARLVENTNKTNNAITCCGAPLVYCSDDAYWVPDSVQGQRSEDEKMLTLTCGNCGLNHTVDIENKTNAK